MKILIVSNSPWRSDNSFGNSFSNIFEGIPDLEIANIYCKYGEPQNNVVSKYFQITEKSLIKNLLKKTPSGKEVFANANQSETDGAETFNKIKKHKNLLMYWLRGLVWKICRWRSPELIKFVDDFKPDMLFIPVYYSYYIHDINKFIKKRFNIPALGYVSDDVYTLRQFSLSPFYWIDRLLMRKKMAKVFSWCRIVYVISETQKKEYSEIFGNKFKVLTKCADFSDGNKPEPKIPVEPLKLFYAGNVSQGRFKILSEIAKAAKELNLNGQSFFLSVYTSSPLSEKQLSELSIDGASKVFPPVSYSEIKKLQSESDILIHAEAFDLRERLAVHQSFSTKIVDYLSANRCIFAVGGADCASIKYFIDNDCAVTATKPEEIKSKLSEIYTEKSLLQGYAEKAWQSGKMHHSRDEMQKNLYIDIKETIGENI